MLMPMNNVEKGGYVPQELGEDDKAESSFVTGAHGYAPVPQYTQDRPPAPQVFEHQSAYGGQKPAHDGRQPEYAGSKPQPIVNQPTGSGSVVSDELKNRRVGAPNCPPGLEYLMTIDELLVKQKVELFQANRKFEIKNSLGQKVYDAVEDNDCCARCCGPLHMGIFDKYNNVVMHLYRTIPCIPCSSILMEVSAPLGHLIGSIEQEWPTCTPSFNIKNERGKTVLRIECPTCICGCADVDFDVVSLTGHQVGKISKQWSGLGREMFTHADLFGVNFAMNLDVRMKAVLLGATFLIDALYFEKR